MSKGVYVGAGGVKKLKQGYVGVNGSVHKVKEIYAGVNGTMKKVWTAMVPAGQVVFTSSQIWTVPVGIKTIDVFCVGGGTSGYTCTEIEYAGDTLRMGTKGGCGGYTKTEKSVAVTPGQQIAVTVGAGGTALKTYISYPTEGKLVMGSDTSCLSCTAFGGGKEVMGTGAVWTDRFAGGSGGGYPGGKEFCDDTGYYWDGGNAGDGGTDGGNGNTNRPDQPSDYGTATFHGGKGQGSTTRSFGEAGGTIYAGGGGGGGAAYIFGQSWAFDYGRGGAGGRAAGGWYGNGASGTPNTGGAGGGGSYTYDPKVYAYAKRYPGGDGGSGIVIIRWTEQ